MPNTLNTFRIIQQTASVNLLNMEGGDQSPKWATMKKCSNQRMLSSIHWVGVIGRGQRTC